MPRGGALQRFVLRTSRSPLKALWWLAYTAAARALAWTFRYRSRERAVYLGGGLAEGEPLYGVSDLDLIVVTPTGEVPGRERARAAARWRAIRERLGIPEGPVHVAVIEQAGLEVAASAPTTFTHGLSLPDESSHPPEGPRNALSALYHGPVTIWDTGGAGLLHGPGLRGPAAEWRRIAGPERRPETSRVDARHRPAIAWLRLQSWWRLAFDACLRPHRAHVPYLCVKLIAEPLRVLLWLERGELVRGRTAPLEVAAEMLPAFGAAARRASELQAALPSSPEPPLARTLEDLVHLSKAIARAAGDLAFADGSVEVAIRGHGDELILDGRPDPGLVPLADWRSRCYWFPPDEALLPVEGSPSAPADVVGAARADDGNRCPALREDELLLLPSGGGRQRTLLRAAQCAASDPVSFALLAGERKAEFPLIPGWSIEDGARRSLAEHRAWLRRAGIPSDEEDRALTLGKLLGAARAALLAGSVAEGAPELPATAVSTAALLAERHPEAAAAAREGVERYRAWREDGAQVPASTIADLTSALGELPAYRDLDRRPGPARSGVWAGGVPG